MLEAKGKAARCRAREWPLAAPRDSTGKALRQPPFGCFATALQRDQRTKEKEKEKNGTAQPSTPLDGGGIRYRLLLSTRGHLGLILRSPVESLAKRRLVPSLKLSVNPFAKRRLGCLVRSVLQGVLPSGGTCQTAGGRSRRRAASPEAAVPSLLVPISASQCVASSSSATLAAGAGAVSAAR